MTTARRKPSKPAGATKAATPTTATAAKQSAAGTIVLTGPPSLLRATVSVENAVDQRVAVRGLTLHRTGRAALAGSGALPFGAEVRDGNGDNVGTVGQGGRIFARMPEGNRLLTVRWGDQDSRQCSIDLSALPARVSSTGANLEHFDGPCAAAAPGTTYAVE